jgi:hypothetical protein
LLASLQRRRAEIDMNKTLDPLGRYNAVMNAPDLFSVESISPAK